MWQVKKVLCELEVPKHPKQRELFSYLLWGQEQSSLLSLPPSVHKVPETPEQSCCVFTLKWVMSTGPVWLLHKSSLWCKQDSLRASDFQHPTVQNWLARIFRQQNTLWMISYILRIKCYRKGREIILDVKSIFIEYPELQNKCWKNQ